MKIKKNCFDLSSSIMSGQCFRMVKEDDGSYTTIIKDRAINIYEDDKYLYISSSKEDDLEWILNYYFDLECDYDEMINILNKDDYMRSITYKCKGYKVFNQDKFEMFISYIISQNNNVKRISNSINKLCMLCGEIVKFNNKSYYLFPTYENLRKLTIQQIRSCGVGFRDKYIINALDYLETHPTFLDDLNEMSTEDALKSLCSIKGIGMKVASCILLFGYHRFDVYPIDTWVIKNISNNYKEVKPDQKSIAAFAKDRYGSLCGLAIQYMFHYERNML